MNLRGSHPTPAVSLSTLRFYIVWVDFEMIPNRRCRDKAWLLPTNFGLEPAQPRAVTELRRVLLGRSVDLEKFYDETNHKRPSRLQDPAVSESPHAKR
jgi:hypothetical protein